MRICLTLLLLALPACRATQVAPLSEPASPQAQPSVRADSSAPNIAAPNVALGGLLPPATKPLKLRPSPTVPATLYDLIDQLQTSTGVGFIIEERTLAALRQTPAGVQGEIDVPAEQAWRVVETILARNEYVLVPTQGSTPQLVTIWSTTQGNAGDLKSQALEVRAAQLEDCVNHPAVLVMTVVDVHPLDARMTATTLRQLIPDQTLHSILPIGEGHQLMIVGLGPEVAKFAGLLRESARVERERAPAAPPTPEAATAR